MITTILIVLVAVVVLIVIIAVLALHFLRADDSDAFDEAHAESRAMRHSPADPPRERVSVGPGPGSRHPEPPRAQWANARPNDERPASFRDRDTAPRPSAADRRNGKPTGPRPAAAGARPAKAPKTAGAEAKAAGWESMSDVDYWAELSADKPQVGPATPPAARPNGNGRRGPNGRPNGRAASEGRPTQRADSGPISGPPAGAGSLPVRPRSQPTRAANSSGHSDLSQTEQFDARAARAGGYAGDSNSQSLAALTRLSASQPPAAPRPDAGHRPAGSQRSGSASRPADGPRNAGQRPSQPASYPRTPAPLDDDPLTSPSFPAINASDSRSYRARRPSGAHSGPHTGPQPATTQYPAQTRSSQPPVQSSSPVANPYGSYVSPPQPAYQPSPPPRPEVPAYNGYGNGQQPDGSWYGGAGTGYLPANGYNPGGLNGNGSHNGNGNGNGHAARDQRDGQDGYGAFDYQNLSYQDASYQQVQPVPGGYTQQNPQAGQFDEHGYGRPDLTYGQDGYQGYPGYGPGR